MGSSHEEELPGNGEEATSADDVLTEAEEKPSSGTTESSEEDKSKGVSDATENPDATSKPDAAEKSEAIQDAPKADLLDDMLEMEIAASAASSEVVAAAN